MIQQIILIFIGIASGLVTAGGVFALITVVGVIPRLAGKTHTARWIHLYEYAVVLGGIWGNLLNLFQFPRFGGQLLLILYGIGSGTYVSCLIMSLAEVLNVVPIMCRRIRLTVGIPYIVLGIALGKVAGALLFFFGK